MTVLSLLNPAGWLGWYRAKLSGGQYPGQAAPVQNGSAAGKAVTAETAMALTAYWSCVRLIAQTIGTLPLELFNVGDDGSRTLAVDNDLYDLLHDQPNAEQTAVEFWEGIGACLAVWGNAYALKQRMGARVVALDLLRPFWMSPLRRKDGSLVYRYSDPVAGAVDYEAEDIMHIRGFGFGDVVGLSPLAFNRNTIGLAIAIDEASGGIFRNGLRIAGWFRYKGGNGVLTAPQREDAKKALIEPYSGSENAGRAGILPGDFEWVATAMNPDDAQLIESRRMSVEDVCRIFGVPPIMIGHSGQGQTMWGTGVDTIVLGFLTTTLRPYLHRIEAAIGRDLIGRAGRRRMRCAFDVEELIRGDNKGRAEVDQSLANTGIMTRNEIRAARGLPPKPGGDTLTVQSALIPIADLGLIAKLPRDKPVDPGADVDPSSEVP